MTLLRVLALLLAMTAWCHALSSPTKIQVCQNKDCCRRFGSSSGTNLVQTIRQLLLDDDVVVESSGCLSHCDKGPNIKIVTNQEMVEHGIDGAPAAAAALSLSLPELQIHSTLLAAQKVMNQASQGMCLFVCFELLFFVSGFIL